MGVFLFEYIGFCSFANQYIWFHNQMTLNTLDSTSLQLNTLGATASCPSSPTPSEPSLRKSPSEGKLTDLLSRKRLQSESEEDQAKKLPRREMIKRHVAQENLIKDDFECSLCYRLLFSPVTTPCGHVFCKNCLSRCLDHNIQCPLCKSCLASYSSDRNHRTTEAVEQIIETYFAEDFNERLKVSEEEMAEFSRMAVEKHEIPIFVCTMAFPRVPCALHVFEPRYRLMIRQCMESGTRQFGMCIGMAGDTYAEYGTLLELRDVQYFPDGRSLADTVGARRFRVLSRSRRDGYDTARVEFLEDTQITEENRQSVQQKHDELYSEARGWFDRLTPVQKQRLGTIGPMPELETLPLEEQHGPAWVWWLLAVLPLDPRAQLTILAMNSLKDRMQALQRVLRYVARRANRQ